MDELYFFAVDGQRKGPISFAALRDLATKGEVKRRSKVWCRSLKDWQAAGWIPNLFDDLPPDLEPKPLPDTPPPLAIKEPNSQFAPGDLWANASPPLMAPAAAEFMKKERQMFIAGYPIAVVFALWAVYLGNDTSDANVAAIAISAILGIGAALFAVVNWLTLHHRLWKLLPPAVAQITPERAVGFYFIPLFNIYWCFVTFKGLATAANKTLMALGHSNIRCNEGLALAFAVAQACALSLGCVIPILGVVAAIASYVLWIPWYADLGKAFVVIEQYARQSGCSVSAQPQPVAR